MLRLRVMALQRLCGSLRARLSVPADCIVLPQSRSTMPSKECFDANADSYAGLVIQVHRPLVYDKIGKVMLLATRCV